MAKTRWIQVDRIQSDSERGVWHKIERHPDSGRVRCDCMSYRFSHAPKSCKHLKARDAREAGHGWTATAAPPQDRSSVQVRLDAETFTVETVRAVRIGGWGKGA